MTKTAEKTVRGYEQRKLFDEREKHGCIKKIKEIESIVKQQVYVDADRVFSISMISYNDTSEFECKCDKSFEGLLTTVGVCQYVWVGLTEDDFVIVIGKTNANLYKQMYGDLFYKYKEWGTSLTPRFITEIVANEEQKIVWNALVDQVNSYIKKAIIIPFNKNLEESASILEKKIGNLLLIDNDIPILNKRSHNYK
ncbi:hypothetical protein [Carnobacterium sp. TMP28]|uniref:hypothetical protein n=1 Tax=Carnobacterium sp. TMP28 TaxID=3397060 RepID=UPI0039E17377